MKSCVFENNSATTGGAVYATNENKSKLVLLNCHFRRNKASVSGGAVYVYSSFLYIAHSDISNNVSPRGSGVLFLERAFPLHIVHSIFSDNKYGTKLLNKVVSGVILVTHRQNVKTYGVQILLIGVVLFKNNAAGGVSISKAKAKIHNCLFQGNVGIYGGAISTMDASSQLVVVNTSFINNRAYYGGSMLLENRNTFIQNCHFEKNVASTGFGVIEICQKWWYILGHGIMYSFNQVT